MSSLFNVDFWAVLEHDEYADFPAIIREIGDLPPGQRLIDRGPDHSDYIELLDHARRQWFGGAAHIRKRLFPRSFNLRTIQRRDLDVTEEEGLEEPVYFLYDEPTRTLAVQRHRFLRIGALRKIITDINNRPIEFQPRLRQDAWDRFGELERISSFTLKIFGPDQHPQFSNRLQAVGALLDQASADINAFDVEIKFSVSKSRTRSLNTNIIQALANRLRRADNIEKLRVTGAAAEGGRSAPIDLLLDRLVFTTEVEYATRSLEQDECQRLLRRAFEEHREYLMTLL